jgi:hypothetical protein
VDVVGQRSDELVVYFLIAFTHDYGDGRDVATAVTAHADFADHCRGFSLDATCVCEGICTYERIRANLNLRGENDRIAVSDVDFVAKP